MVPARGPAKYDSSKADGGMIASVPATYNTGADVAMADVADEKPDKKKKVCSFPSCSCLRSTWNVRDCFIVFVWCMDQ